MILRRPASTVPGLAVLLASVALAGCGGSDAPDRPAPKAQEQQADPPVPAVVARIGREPVTRAEYRKVEAFEQALGTAPIAGKKSVTALRPPRVLTFANGSSDCADEIKQIARDAYFRSLDEQGRKATCRRTAVAIRQRAINTILASRLNVAEARAAGVQATSREIDRYLQQDLLPITAGSRAKLPLYTRLTGVTAADLHDRARADVLSKKLQIAVVRRRRAQLTTADVRRYYDEHPAQFSTLERRQVSVIALRSAADAERAKAEIAAGASFADVARRRSTERTTAKRGGRIGTKTKIEVAPVLRDPVFAAKPGVVSGPVVVPGGELYLFRVGRVTPAKRLSFAAVRKSAEESVNRSDFIWQTWQLATLKRWKPRITCAKGYNIVALCSNRGPDPVVPPSPLVAKGQNSGTS